MTNEEAIEILNNWSPWQDIGDYDRFRDALDIAIQALEQQPCEDCISRQTAIDAIKKIHPVDTEYDCTLYDKIDVMYMLEDLPSVTPSYNLEPYSERLWKNAYERGKADAEQTRWIPVSERLPEEGQKVLVTDIFESVTTAICFKENPFWREMVVAWQPLPEPYKPQKKECADCKHYGKLSLDCGRCDDNCSMFAPQESEDNE